MTDALTDARGAPEAVLGPRTGTLARVLRVPWPARARLLLALLLGVGATAAAVGLTATSAWLISRAAQHPPVLYLLVAVVSVRAFGVARGVLRYAERLVAHDAALRLLATLRSEVYRRLERLAPAGLADMRSGDLVARLVGDVDGLVDVWPRVILPFGVAAIVGCGAVTLVALLVPAAGFVLALTLVAAAVGGPLVGAVVAGRAERRIGPLRGELSATAYDLLQAGPELVVAGAAERHLGALDTLSGRIERAESRSALGTGLSATLGSLMAGLAVWTALALGAAAVRSGDLDGVLLAVVVLTPIAAHDFVAGLAAAAQQVARLWGSAVRLDTVLTRHDPVVDPAHPRPSPAGPYGVRIRGLRAGYASGPLVLDGLDLDIAAGSLTLVTGPSGAGKSTLALVLLRLLDPDAGLVELTTPGGVVDLRELDGDDVRRIIGLCSQDAHVFDSTIAENVRLARPRSTDQEVSAALRSAGLAEWIGSLPDGIGTFVGESGARISGGQRQRLELARSILADRPVVILDEPTEHLDEPTTRALLRDLRTFAAGRTVLYVTHRPELLDDWVPRARVELQIHRTEGGFERDIARGSRRPGS